MGYKLTATELAQLQELRARIEGTLDPSQSPIYWTGPDSDFSGKYYLAYQYLFAIQTTTQGGILTPIQSADPNVWLWLRGAQQINAGVGAFSAFIRSYSAEQYLLRT